MKDSERDLGACWVTLRLVGRYEISRDPERWLDINRYTGDITAKRSFNMRSPHVRNNIYRAVVKVTGRSVCFACLSSHVEAPLIGLAPPPVQTLKACRPRAR